MKRGKIKMIMLETVGALHTHTHTSNSLNIFWGKLNKKFVDKGTFS